MTARGFALFDTTIGRCGIAWGEHGVLATQLPEVSDRATQARMLRRAPDLKEAEPPAEIQRVIAAITALMLGERVDLSNVALDMGGVSPFHRSVYEVARTIPAGRTQTYGDIAKRLGDPGLARAVGQALGENPFPIIVPCHRVLAAGGKAGGFSAGGGTKTKLRMLAIERARSGDAPDLFDLDEVDQRRSSGKR